MKSKTLPVVGRPKGMVRQAAVICWSVLAVTRSRRSISFMYSGDCPTVYERGRRGCNKRTKNKRWLSSEKKGGEGRKKCRVTLPTRKTKCKRDAIA